MARLFDDGSSQYLVNSSAILTAAPMSMSCQFNSDSVAVGQALVSVSDTNLAIANFFTLYANGASGGNEVLAITKESGPSQVQATTTTGYSANTWHHAAGVWAASDSRAVYIDGGSKGTEASDRTPASIDELSIASVVSTSRFAFVSGRVAEVGLWNIALTDAEVAILALGYSPLLVRPQSLVACWPLIGRTSPEIDLVGGYDMTLTNAPTAAAHPPVIYPSQQIYTIPTQGATTMGRMYSVSNTVAGVTAAIDLVRISAPTDAVVVLHKIVVTQETEFADAQSEMLDVMIHRGSTDGSGGATPTPSPLEVGDSAFGGTAATGNTTQSTDGTIMHREAWHVAAGFHYPPTPEEKIVLSPSGRIVCSLETAPDDSVDFRVTAYIEEIGG